MTQPVDDREEALRRAEERFLRRRGLPETRRGDAPPWNAAFFRVERVARFRNANAGARRAVLEACAAGLLAESWFIERCGVTFCAKMTLLSQSLEEQRAYALIGADEATHSAWLEPWIADRDGEADPFNRFIVGLVEAGSAQPLAFLLQVVLEGFGIVHYTDLAAACLDAPLAATLRRMARDEAMHHAVGLAAFRSERLSVPERRFLAEGAHAFLEMIRNGPQAVVAALDRVIGEGDQADATHVFEDLGAEAASAAKLAQLRRLMAQPGMDWLIDEFERKGVFAPCTAAECARVYAVAR